MVKTSSLNSGDNLKSVLSIPNLVSNFWTSQTDLLCQIAYVTSHLSLMDLLSAWALQVRVDTPGRECRVAKFDIS